MGLHCKHCGLGYAAYQNHDGFCCSGCAQVYTLIQNEGMGDFYTLQDRIGKPPELGGPQGALSWARKLQAAVETGEGVPGAKLSVSGMTCVGCAWLVQKLSSGLPGLKSIQVDLEGGFVSIRWMRGTFSLVDWVQELRRFGYIATEANDATRARLSPLLWRISLCTLFGVNALLLEALPSLGLDLSAYANLLSLLLWFMVAMSVLVGVSFFALPVYQSLRVKRWHYDGQIACGLILAYLLSALGLVSTSLAQVLFLLVIILTTRWLHRSQWARDSVSTGKVDSTVLNILQYCGLAVIVWALVLCALQKWEAAISVLFSSSLYPVAKSVGYSPGRRFVSAYMLTGVLGIAIFSMFPSVSLAVFYALLMGVICNFLFFRLHLDGRNRID